MKKLYLLDAYAYIFRAYHALPPLTSPCDNLPIGAVYGFMNMVLKLIREEKPDYVAAIFDSPHQTHRRELYADYKGNRVNNKRDDLNPQFALVRELTAAMGIASYEMPGYEADDIIATFASRAAAQDLQVTIVSSDKDLCQLVNDKIRMYDSMRSVMIGRDEVIKKFGVPPEKLADMMALWGDASDNVPGVPGIGMKGAAELVRQCGDLEAVLRYADEIPQKGRRENLLKHADQARLSLKLVTLDYDVPVHFQIEDMKQKDYVNTLWEFAATHSFFAVLHELSYEREKRRAAV